MSEKTVQLNEEVIKGQIKELARGSTEETLTYSDFPYEHWARIRTNNVIEHRQGWMSRAAARPPFFRS